MSSEYSKCYQGAEKMRAKKSDETTLKSSIAYEKIYDLILSGKKLPGTHLILSDLEQELGIGRGPIRDALMRLDRSGLVQNIPYKGVVIAPLPTFKEIEQIYVLRIELELFLTKEAMNNFEEAAFFRLEELLNKMQNFSPLEFVQCDREFHVAIYEQSKMPHLCMMAEKIFETVAVFLRVQHPDKQMCIDSMEEHQAVLDALKTKNFVQLRIALTNNIYRGLQIIHQAYAHSHNNSMLSKS